jgi:glycosyltransferase involved in cell wall biosynthesis
VTLPPDRLVTASEADALSIADAFIGVGNEATRRTYAGFDPVHLLPSVAWPDEHRLASSKDLVSGRRHFLFLAGPGNVHKGLDLLLDAFDGLRDEHLWICTRIDRPFAAVYGDLLTRRSNIHLLEWVQRGSAVYDDALRRSNWIILPSCAEGIATSVIEAMSHGLIPVVSEACGIDAGASGVQLTTCSVGEIASTVRELSSFGEERCREMSRAAERAATEGHSPHVGARRIREALGSILAGRNLERPRIALVDEAPPGRLA